MILDLQVGDGLHGLTQSKKALLYTGDSCRNLPQ